MSVSENTLVISYLFLRRAVGILGLTLPFVLAFGGMALYGLGVQSSISGYYHTGMRDVFVGVLCAIAMFLLSYEGYDAHDRVVGILACLFALGVAFFPTAPVDPAWKGIVHVLSTTGFFLMLAYFSLVLFTETDLQKAPTSQKLRRNHIYRLCGYIMLACLVSILVIELVPALRAALEGYDPVFWLESIAIVAFGFSWLTKGEWILADR
jgi:hypothetical protein